MRDWIAKTAIVVISLVFVVAALAVLLWMANWWPEQLIPWVPFNRI